MLVLNPKQARDLLAKEALGVLRKSDHTDAIVLGQCAKMKLGENYSPGKRQALRASGNL